MVRDVEYVARRLCVPGISVCDDASGVVQSVCSAFGTVLYVPVFYMMIEFLRVLDQLLQFIYMIRGHVLWVMNLRRHNK